MTLQVSTANDNFEPIEEVSVHDTFRCSLCPVLGANASRGASCAALPLLVCALQHISRYILLCFNCHYKLH
ncbi:MAG: hypothetical protein J6M62_11900 [Selenomonadaceae bacterium]|nr:hypothetical protein [Selenomonadaceae bacterium]